MRRSKEFLRGGHGCLKIEQEVKNMDTHTSNLYEVFKGTFKRGVSMMMVV